VVQIGGGLNVKLVKVAARSYKSAGSPFRSYVRVLLFKFPDFLGVSFQGLTHMQSLSAGQLPLTSGYEAESGKNNFPGRHLD